MVKPISSACMTDALYARMQKAGSSARTEVYAIEEWERVQAEAALAKEQEEAILVRTCLHAHVSSKIEDIGPQRRNTGQMRLDYCMAG